MRSSYSRIQLNHTLFLAIVVHAVVVLGVGFGWARSSTAADSIEVTIAEHKSSEKLDEADFFAQVDQLGSGVGEKPEKLSQQPQAATQFSQQENRTPSSQTEEVTASPQNSSPKPKIEKNIADFDVISTTSSEFVLVSDTGDKNTDNVSNTSQNNSLSAQIVALKSQIDLRNQQIAKAPRKRVISTMSTKSHQDAAYLENWRKRIVTVGNIHYPKAANDQKIYGRVRLLVAMRADGNIKSIEILESSGKPILDQGAINIIRLAAPFAPFSQQMRKNTDILEIIRTIEFEKSTQIY